MSKYKVLADGSGSDLIQVFGLGVYVPLSNFEKLTAERDAALAREAELVAQVELLRKLFPLKILVGCDGHLNYPVSQYNDVVEAFNKSPTQCLRDVKAEAGRAGFVEGYDSCWFQHYGTRPPEHATAYSANQYAEKVRSGEV